MDSPKEQPEEEEIKLDLLPRTKYSPEEIIVVAPGTATFKIGLASLKNPVSVPSIFALKRKTPFCTEHPKKDYFDMSKIIEFSLNSSDELKIKNELLSLCLRSEVHSNYIEVQLNLKKIGRRHRKSRSGTKRNTARAIAKSR